MKNRKTNTECQNTDLKWSYLDQTYPAPSHPSSLILRKGHRWLWKSVRNIAKFLQFITVEIHLRFKESWNQCSILHEAQISKYRHPWIHYTYSKHPLPKQPSSATLQVWFSAKVARRMQILLSCHHHIVICMLRWCVLSIENWDAAAA